MASMRKLRRRLQRWERYTARYRHLGPAIGETATIWHHIPPGHMRAINAVEVEDLRRFWDETPEIWLGGPEGEAALIRDVTSEGVNA